MEEYLHKIVSFLCQTFSFGCIYFVFYLLEFHGIFAICRVFFGIFGIGIQIGIRVVKFGVMFSSKQECPTDSDSADAIEFIGIEQDFRLERFREIISTETMCSNTVNNFLDFVVWYFK